MALPSETQAPHLALPLVCKPSVVASAWSIWDAKGRCLATVLPAPDAQRRANQIIEAVNAYPDLMTAVRAAEVFARNVAKAENPTSGVPQ